jgi:aspartyl-tRNA(Asn)/glutamyl-tRNA(Gln) amidotransferase subunit A
MTDLLTIADAGKALRAGETTSVQLVEAALAAADEWEPELGVFLARFSDQARAAAKQADAELGSGRDRGPMHGIPLGIKDIIATQEGPATAQSLILDPDWTGSGDAVVVDRLRNAGGIMVGKTTTCEFAIGFPDAEKPFPVPRNPWDLTAWPGGSSSGTGAGIPSGLFLGGLGTDTGGSVRMPAAYCGISGMKATYGLVPKAGCVPLAYTLDGIGPMARSALDCALMLGVMAGHHPDDPTSKDRPVEDFLGGLVGDLHGLRIGVDSLARVATTTDPALPGLLDDAVEVMRSAGAKIVEVKVPMYEELCTAQLITMTSEAAAYHLPDLQRRWSDYGAGARNFIMGGVTYSAPDYVQAQRIRRLGQKMLADLFTEVDLIITPPSTMPAPLVADLDPLNPMQSMPGLMTQYWNTVGNPTLSIPVGFNAQRMPLGIQLSGRPFDDATVLRAGHAYQQHTEWHLRRPTPARLGAAVR